MLIAHAHAHAKRGMIECIFESENLLFRFPANFTLLACVVRWSGGHYHCH